jgi:sugar O-acyltransferase (sialic acid O-acetyltransferase NeuD family)
MGRVVIWGAGGHAKVIADALRNNPAYELAGFLDDVNPDRKGEVIGAVPVLGGRDELVGLLSKGIKRIVIGVGDCEARMRLAQCAMKAGFALATIVHSRSIIASDAVIGQGTFIGAGAVVNAGARIGENVIINTGAIVEHDCLIGSGAHLCPGVVTGGGTSIGEKTWVGIGATLRDHLTIGNRVVVGAGAVVVSDLPDDVLAYGVPARIRNAK